jgi:hypothetical protein
VRREQATTLNLAGEPSGNPNSRRMSSTSEYAALYSGGRG